MSDIFISYAREDFEKARQLAAVLEAQGWSVFWDRTIPPGKTWREIIGKALSDARSMVVLWSTYSVNSEWVLEEADYGRNRQVLVPIFIENVDPPLGFGGIQAADLSNWTGKADHHGLNVLIAAITDILREQSSPQATPSEPEIPAEGEDTTGKIEATAAREEKRTPTPERTPPSGESDLSIAPSGARPRGKQKTGILIAGVIAVVVIATVIVMQSRTKEPEAEKETETAEESLKAIEPDTVDIPGTNYAMGKYEVTQGQWQAVMGYNPSEFSQGDEYPVENVSWDNVQEYIDKLNSMTGKQYRLPTEEEWYKACQAGGPEQTYCGGEDLDELGWYQGNSNGSTHPVGTKTANRLGIYDMTGNVSEWTSGLPSGSSGIRAVRGGLYYHGPDRLHSAHQSNYYTTVPGHSGIGFRLAQDIK